MFSDFYVIRDDKKIVLNLANPGCWRKVQNCTLSTEG